MPPPTPLDDRDRPDTAVSARFWHRLDDGRLQCDLWPHHCRLRNSQGGRCFAPGQCLSSGLRFVSTGNPNDPKAGTAWGTRRLPVRIAART